MNDRPEPVRRAVGLRLAAGMDQWRALVAECVDRAERWANGIAHLENWMNRRPAVPGYLTPTDEQRAAALLVHYLRGDMAARAVFYKAMFELGMTMNQILALEDMNGIGAEGDVNFVSNNVQTLERAINGEPPSPPAPIEEQEPA